jgi:hypothetical protein
MMELPGLLRCPRCHFQACVGCEGEVALDGEAAG